MKLSKAILLADMLVPNDVPAELKVHYLSEVEGMCVTEVMLLSTDDVPVYSSDDLDVEMLVKAPHDKLYVDYLAAMLHFANGEFNKYANVFERFNKSYGEYHRFIFNTVHPADGDAVRELYYVSAYAIAVAHGYKGSEDEFGELMQTGGKKGDDGITPHIGVNGNWFIGDTDTGVKATGYTPQKGIDYFDGANGITPHIGANGNWFVGDTDTGVYAAGGSAPDMSNYYTKNEVDAALGAYITDVDALIGGDV